MPTILIADGGEGSPTSRRVSGPLEQLPIRGDEGTASPKLAALEELDMVSYHLYPKNYGLESPRDIEIWIQRHRQRDGVQEGRLPGRMRLGASDAEPRPSSRRLAAPPLDENGGPLG